MKCFCGNEATCIGRYEGDKDERPACDVCCGHGNEDGQCQSTLQESLCVVCNKPFTPKPDGDPYACSACACACFEIGGLLLAIGDKNG